MHKVRIMALAALATLTAAPSAQAQQGASFTVAVSELRSTQGQLIVCLFATRDRFPICRQGDGVPRHVFRVTGQTMRVTVPLPRPGSYAVTVIHDEDMNGRLKQNFIGMPTEGVGVTGNPGGIPRFAGSVVDLAAGSVVGVRVRYL
ncbi:DUF2141 domain-containing protein [Alteraurantiacibacter buctensis]|uniref:DUF2141 domain-containing protein n=1 Tax=Alteraurantiacibacter buctensis TaxID=1503981 RepID=A0A844Z1A7_9SPHN|nr:DUF2141 domain-containing protein [Alteraurantiacibacter buctensis]MXO73128.1 DUF2141 domain-containing protein [Alteraurantiacibacter buctensis]